jgi:hypothetical protein
MAGHGRAQTKEEIMSDEERALELLEAARKKLMRAATCSPDVSADFADAICGLEELVWERSSCFASSDCRPAMLLTELPDLVRDPGSERLEIL